MCLRDVFSLFFLFIFSTVVSTIDSTQEPRSMRTRNALVSFRLEKETSIHSVFEHFWIRDSYPLDYLQHGQAYRFSSVWVFPPSITLIARVPWIAASEHETGIDLTMDKQESFSKLDVWNGLEENFFLFFPLLSTRLGIFFSNSFFFFFLNHPVYKHIMKRERVFQMCIQACCSLTYRFTHQHSSAYLASSVS